MEFIPGMERRIVYAYMDEAISTMQYVKQWPTSMITDGKVIENMNHVKDCLEKIEEILRSKNGRSN